MKTRYLTLIAILCVLLFGAEAAALPCQCSDVRSRRPPYMSFWQTNVAFVGRVLQVSPDFSDVETSRRLGRRTIIFAISRVYNGRAGEQFRLDTRVGSCEVEFKVGEEYFVYAHHDSEDRFWETSKCAGTIELAGAEEDVAYGEKIAKGIYEITIGGLVFEGEPEPGAKIVAEEKSGARYEARPNRYGRFDMLVPRGSYVVQIILPPNYQMTDKQRQAFGDYMYERDGHVVFHFRVVVGPKSSSFNCIMPFMAQRRQ